MKFRLWVNYLRNNTHYIPVNTIGEVLVAFEMLATLAIDFEEICNVSGLEVFNEESNEWEEWYDAEGNSSEDYWNAHMAEDLSTILNQHNDSLESLTKEVPVYWQELITNN